jgi:hypothetical protein
MEIETLNSKALYIRNKRLSIYSLFPYDLPGIIKNMKNTPAWKHGELAATILLKSPNKQIVLTVLHDDTEVNSFQSGDSITFQIIEGKIELHTPDKTVVLNNGQFLTLHDKTKFRLTSLEESIFLLTFLTAQ